MKKESPPLRLLVFDMDVTFMDSRAFHTNVFHRFINRNICTIDLENTQSRMGNTIRHILKNVGVTDEMMPNIYAKLTEFFSHDIDDLIRQIQVVDGIEQALDNAHGCGLYCVLLTNSADVVARKMLEHHGLLDKFDYISGADLESMDKIDRCREVIRVNGFTPEETVCIGDAESDIEMANAVGCRSCFVRTDASWFKDETYIINVLRPTFIVSSLQDIPSAFFTNAQRIQTIAGPIDPINLGFCQCHEHLLLKKGKSWEVNNALCIDEPELSLLELKDYRKSGGTSIVDAQPIGCGRMAKELYSLSIRAQVPILASTGFHKLCFYPDNHWLYSISEKELCSLYIRELTEGMYLNCDYGIPQEQIPQKAGIIKTALDVEGLTPCYEKLFCAAAGAQIAVGAPMMIHIEKGANPLMLLEWLKGKRVRPNKLIFCHLDRAIADLSVHETLLAAGAYLEYDTIGRFKYHSDERELEIIKHMVDRGYQNQLLFSLDTTRERLKRYTPEGIGLTYIRDVFLQKMIEAGLPIEVIDDISINNCRAALCRSF